MEQLEELSYRLDQLHIQRETATVAETRKIDEEIDEVLHLIYCASEDEAL